MTTVSTKSSYILDANVLIDYFNSDLSILGLFCEHIGNLFVATPVLDEVEQLDNDDLSQFGIEIVEPDIELLIEAAALHGALSFQDWICIRSAKEKSWTCVTNDRTLRKACKHEGIKLCWGLELMIHLVNAGKLERIKAAEVANQMHKSNPRFLRKEVIEDFNTKIGLVTRIKK
ncbi:MAG TPA: hypothetical protein PKW95_22215 [bacterium]|nr:hypothetical protein [bacterium]